jgi:pimeloyl-ACP methyl ester carboxylesterase
MRRIRVAFVGALLSVTALAASPAKAEPAHAQPQKAAKVAFAPDFPALVDHEWGFALGGFGGAGKGTPVAHTPVIFVHGNTVDAADWYPVRDEFRAAGWTDQELWALSYNGLGGNSGTGVKTQNPKRSAEHTEMGWDGQVRVTNNEVNVADLYDFILAVREYTGSKQFTLIGHSLGVTVARRTLKLHPELRSDLIAFVGIAGGNHGTSLCPPGSEGNVVSCDEIAAGTPWLADLNGKDASDETYGPAKWMTVYDGSGAGDPAYAGPNYAQSPALKGALNKEFANTYHNDLREDPAIIKVYRAFVEDADKPTLRGVSGGGGGTQTAGASSTGGGTSPSGSSPARPATSFRPPSVATTTPSAVPAGTQVAASARPSNTGPVSIPTSSSGRRQQGLKASWVLWLLGGLFVIGVGLVAFDRRRAMRPAIA